MDQSEVLKFEQAVRPLKLSEAIRIGSRIRPQCENLSAVNGKSCAFMAAAEATGLAYKEVSSNFGFGDIIRHLRKVGLYPNRTVVDAILGRNDSGESRESIADWLAEQGL